MLLGASSDTTGSGMPPPTPTSTGHADVAERFEHGPRQAPGVDVARPTWRTGRDDDRMAINRAADVGVLVVVSVVGQGGVLFVEDQAGRQKLEVGNGADYATWALLQVSAT
jgi:hypothetical protein